MSEQKIPIPARLYNAAVGGHICGTEDIIDDDKNKTQKQINSEVEESLGTGGSVDSRIASAVATEANRAQAAEADRYTKSETYTKEEVHNLITTPNQEYVSVTATTQTTAVTDVLPATGAADTTYRVGNWDGTQYNDSVFSEYAWNGNTYIKLSTKSQVGEVYDISANHADTKYADLAAALGINGANIPQSLQKGGMSIKFVQSSDNKYVQYRLMSNSFNTTLANWQGVDDVPTAGSDNLVKSGGVYANLNDGYTKQEIIDDFVEDGALTTGGILPVGGYKTSDYIDISNIVGNIVLNNVYENQYGVRSYVIYDKYKNVIGNNADPSEGRATDYTLAKSALPNGYAYIRCCEYTPLGSSTITINNLIPGVNNRIDEINSKITEITDGFERFSDSDIDTENTIGDFTLQNNSITDVTTGVIMFKPDILAIQFKLEKGWDRGFISLCFGCGLNNDTKVFADFFIGTTDRTDVPAQLKNYRGDSEQQVSVDGKYGRFGSEYRNVSNIIAFPSVGDYVRIEYSLDRYFLGWRLVNNKWVWWFTIDTQGNFMIPDRYGWNTRKGIGFIHDWGYQEGTPMVSDLKILSRKGTYLEEKYNATKNYPISKDWVALGDSITGIDENNGLSYVGYVNRRFGININNQALSGWTIWRYWKYRATAGWENAIRNMEDNGIISLMMGTNDFDTYSFYIPSSDADMDARDDSHPRFGSVNPEAEVFNNSCRVVRYKDVSTSLIYSSSAHILTAEDVVISDGVITQYNSNYDNIIVPTNIGSTTITKINNDVFSNVNMAQVPLSVSIGDEYDEHTTLGCLRLILMDIQNIKPDAKLFVFTPLYRNKALGVVDDNFVISVVNYDGRTLEDYANAIYEVTKKLDIPVFNSYKDSGINPLTLEQYTYDNLHVNQDGGEIVGDYVAGKIKHIFSYI